MCAQLKLGLPTCLIVYSLGTYYAKCMYWVSVTIIIQLSACIHIYMYVCVHKIIEIYIHVHVCIFKWMFAIGGEVLAHESADYNRVYKTSLDYPEVFWSSLAKKFLTWRENAFETINSCDFKKGRIEWFRGGILNASGNKHILMH